MCHRRYLLRRRHQHLVRKFKSTLVEVSSHGAPGAEKDIGLGHRQLNSSVSASRCYAAIANSSDSHIDSSTTAPSTSRLPWDRKLRTSSPVSSRKLRRSGNDDGTAYVIPLNRDNRPAGQSAVIDGMSAGQRGRMCDGDRLCRRRFRASSGSRISDIENGKAQPAKAASGQELEGVACSTSTTCWAIGDSSKGAGIVVAVTAGVDVRTAHPTVPRQRSTAPASDFSPRKR